MWGFDNPEFIGVYKSKDIDTIWTEYFDAINQWQNTIIWYCWAFGFNKSFKFYQKKILELLQKDALKK